ncbi:hypothetical protein [Mucilaginibacter sp. SJ]|uniref:hypothetical protein n=1 Tax=Mucilaginibacter sp. SJ TaxID=3029053 RepID=UPI0023A96502|nr:hypothetical protein [Mucilaginibacter sp. SJ]WEA01759.1 hypothetical protein MusilaSJ_02335 [Mucilaginibacter sp. SJ]
MNAREKVEYERMNALPRKSEGFAAYYYKPQTKYPPRIYIFMHSEVWCDRNRRPMGLHTAFPFLTRPMNREEIEYHHFDTRLCYHQYEDWDKLIYAEQQEADELDKENAGSGTQFLNTLRSFRSRYLLGGRSSEPQAAEAVPAATEDNLTTLLADSDELTATEISKLLDKEQQEDKRPDMLTALRLLYLNTAQEQKVTVTEAVVQRKVRIAAEGARRNFVRRVYAANKLFALEEIRQRYPEYTEDMLGFDLSRKSKRIPKKKHKPIVDLRRCQMQKYAQRLSHPETTEQEYHQACCMIPILQNAHDQRMPISLSVTYNKKTLIYAFNWRTRETVIRSFITQANLKGMTHERLGETYNQMTGSNYSF